MILYLFILDFIVSFPTYISLPIDEQPPLPSHFKFQDVRYSPSLVRYFLNKFTNPGDLVFDPFAGFGTTLVVARQLGRNFLGIELMKDRVDYLTGELEMKDSIIWADITRFNIDKLDPVDFVMTSPPFMGKSDSANALSGYQYRGTYQQYLTELGEIFEKISKIMYPGAYLVVEISNLKTENEVTTLAWDVGKSLSNFLHFRGEIVIIWEGDQEEDGIYGYGYDHSYCLLYQK